MDPDRSPETASAHRWPWWFRVGAVSLAASFLGLVSLAAAGAPSGHFGESLVAAAGLIGLLLIWGHAIRFYLRVRDTLGLTRSIVYLCLLIGMNWLSAFIFLKLEGASRFFGHEPPDC